LLDGAPLADSAFEKLQDLILCSSMSKSSMVWSHAALVEKIPSGPNFQHLRRRRTKNKKKSSQVIVICGLLFADAP